jgi:sarcosine oxidase subunit alpha
MTASRLAAGGSAIDRSRPIRFSFDGVTVPAFAGDSIASALLAADIAVVGRSFKYHRPRGIWGAGVEEPNALVDVGGSAQATPNTRATTEPARDGLVAKSVNAWPSAQADRNAFLDRFSRFIPAAFYYKTFMWPDWHRFEPRIRAMAGLGKVDTEWTSPGPADQINHHCDVLVVGAGPAGLAAAKLAAGAGLSVTLVDDQQRPGGSLGHRAGEIDSRPAMVMGRGDGGRACRRRPYDPALHHRLRRLRPQSGRAEPTTFRRTSGHVVAGPGTPDRAGNGRYRAPPAVRQQ